ncbi:MAG: glycosyltransferase [Polyangiaceae bacterium]
MATHRTRVALCIPCLNEEPTIAGVVRDFRAALPEAHVYVLDNASTDATARVAAAAGATVLSVAARGKGRVVREMFRRISADVYLMVDGDGTYPASAAGDLVAPVLAGCADMVVGSRLHQRSTSRFRFLNWCGNIGFMGCVNLLFGARLTDLLSGYRAFSRAFAERTPLSSDGFEIETELTVRALLQRERVLELPVDLGVRPPGSTSKIRVLRDGLRILGTIVRLAARGRPAAVPLLGTDRARA